MEIKLNLIPPLRKKEIKKSYFLRLLARWQVEIFLILLIFLVLLWQISYILKIEAGVTLKQIELSRQSFSYKDMEDYQQKIKAANIRVSEIERIQNGQWFWSELLEQLNSLVPAGIKIETLGTKNFQVFLTGMADNRDNLVGFKDKLAQEACFQEIDFPLSNLMEKENLAFQMEFHIKEECLKLNP